MHFRVAVMGEGKPRELSATASTKYEREDLVSERERERERETMEKYRRSSQYGESRHCSYWTNLKAKKAFKIFNLGTHR